MIIFKRSKAVIEIKYLYVMYDIFMTVARN